MQLPPPAPQVVPTSNPPNEILSQRSQLFDYVSLPFEIPDSNWPVEDVESILTTIYKLKEGNITTQGMEWLHFSATQPAKTDRSAREQAAWLFFRVRLGLGSWSVCGQCQSSRLCACQPYQRRCGLRGSWFRCHCKGIDRRENGFR